MPTMRFVHTVSLRFSVGLTFAQANSEAHCKRCSLHHGRVQQATCEFLGILRFPGVDAFSFWRWIDPFLTLSQVRPISTDMTFDAFLPDSALKVSRPHLRMQAHFGQANCPLGLRQRKSFSQRRSKEMCTQSGAWWKV